MAQEVSLQTGDSVSVMCFSFQNPLSINGPFGTFQLWVDGTNVLGRMTMSLLFGMPANTILNLEGTSSGTGPIVCNLQGKGYYAQFGSSPIYAELGMTISFSSDWSKGELVFSEGVIGVSGGLPVQREACTST